MSAAKNTPLTGAEKAAMVVLFLEEELATQVLASLDDDELRELAKAVEGMNPVPHHALGQILTEFESSLKEPVLMGAGSSYMRRLASGAVGEDRARELFSTGAKHAPTGPLEILASARASTLAELLVEEHPQVAAVILTQLPPDHASNVLSEMSEDEQVNVLRRVARLEEIPKAVLDAASESIMGALSAAGGVAGSTESAEFEGVDFAASLLNSLPPEDCERLLECLDDDELDIGGRVREAMFTFEDLGRLDTRGLQQLLREVSTDDLAVALRSAGEGLRDVFFGAISSRAAATLREDLEFMPPKRLSEVEAAQKNIVEVAMQLAASGSIDLPGKSGEEMV